MVQEGVVQYRCELDVGSPATEIQVQTLAQWRRELFALDAIGCDLSRYGACYGNVSVRTGPWAAGPGRREFLVSCTTTGGDAELDATRVARVFYYDHQLNFVRA